MSYGTRRPVDSYYVILDLHGNSVLDGEGAQWSLPTAGGPGAWCEAAKGNALRLTFQPEFYYSAADEGLYEAEYTGEPIEPAQCMIFGVRRARLLRRLTDAEMTALQIYRRGSHMVFGGTVSVCGDAKVDSCEALVRANEQAYVEAGDGAQVVARGDVRVVAYSGAFVEATGRTHVKACGGARVEAKDAARVAAFGDARICASAQAVVDARDRAQVAASDQVVVTARDEVLVDVDGDAIVEAYDSAVVTQRSGQALVRLHGDAVRIDPRGHRVRCYRARSKGASS